MVAADLKIRAAKSAHEKIARFSWNYSQKYLDFENLAICSYNPPKKTLKPAKNAKKWLNLRKKTAKFEENWEEFVKPAKNLQLDS